MAGKFAGEKLFVVAVAVVNGICACACECLIENGFAFAKRTSID